MIAGPTLAIPYTDERCMIATLGPLVVPLVGKEGFSVASAKAQARAIEAHGRSVGRGRLLELSIIDAEVPMPDAEVRAILDGAVPAISPYYAAVAAVFAGSGFKAAVIRGVITSFQLLSRTPYPQKVFANLDDAAAFLLPHLTQAGMPMKDAAELSTSLQGFCAQADARGMLSSAMIATIRR